MNAARIISPSSSTDNRRAQPRYCTGRMIHRPKSLNNARWELATDLQPWIELLPRPAIHPDLAALAALSAPDKHGAARSIEITLLKSEGFADS
jgi:hypothetical protein